MNVRSAIGYPDDARRTESRAMGKNSRPLENKPPKGHEVKIFRRVGRMLDVWQVDKSSSEAQNLIINMIRKKVPVVNIHNE